MNYSSSAPDCRAPAWLQDFTSITQSVLLSPFVPGMGFLKAWCIHSTANPVGGIWFRSQLSGVVLKVV
ncbi:hypothetical protein EYF80_055277 [Liparis tanakae]|uniref:Uncharacterized protein n=1 Tax=Liparis tanakae TaxID=230148 RepID=A0A4Z2F000_9TELE|nr:hypothetical protein EYF80_055277 [Liparis tanakae]